MFVKVIWFIMIFLILTGCEGSTSLSTKTINNKETLKNTPEIVVTSTQVSANIPIPELFQDVLNSPTLEREKVITSFIYPTTSNIPLGTNDEYAIAFLKVIFDPNVPFLNQFQERPKIDFDDQLLIIDSMSFEDRAKMDFLIINLNQATIVDSNIDLSFDSVAVYMHNSFINIAFYKENHFIKGYSIEKSYYAEVLKKTLDLLLYIQVAGAE
jgi:hypothetical protein